MSDDDYKVGYRKPPKHSQYPPGVSGNTGRRKRPSEGQKEIIARVRDELVLVNGRQMTKFELAIHHVFNNTIKSGKPRDLKALLELLDKHGALSEVDRMAEARAGADEVMKKMLNSFYRINDIDRADVEAVERDSEAEARIILACPSCKPALEKRWSDPERKARAKRYGTTGLHKQVIEVFDPKSKQTKP